MRNRNIFWGIILITIGALFAFRNFDLFFFSWWDVVRLWPLLLVLLGITALPIKNGVKVALSIATFLVALLLLLAGPHGTSQRHHWWSHRWNNWEKPQREITQQRIYEPFDEEVKEARFAFEAAIGSFKINSTTSNLFEFEKRGNVGKYTYSVREMDGSRMIEISLDKATYLGGSLKNKVDLSLNPSPLWDIEIDVGAAAIDMDLREFYVRSVDINGGASAVELVLGDRYDKTLVDIDAGASSIEISIPFGSGCKIITEAVLTAKKIKGFDKTGSGTYVTANFDESENIIIINLDLAVSSLVIDRY